MDFKKIVLHPYFFLSFILLFLYSQNIHQLEFTSILLPLAVCLAATWVLSLIVNKIIKDIWKSGIVLSLFVLFFFNYGRLLDARDSPPHIEGWIWKIALASIFISVLGIVIYYLFLRKKGLSKNKNSILVLVISFLAIFTSVYFRNKMFPYIHPLKFLYFITDHQIILLSMVSIFFVGLICWFRLKDKNDYSSINYYANFFSLMLIILALFQMTTHSFSNENNSKIELTLEIKASSFEEASIDSKNPPDVYYIILDGYAGQKILQEDHHFDNSYFISELEKRGFYIARESRSNYLMTFLSLTSSLNMKHITFLGENGGELSKDRTIPYYLMDYNAVAKNFKSLGYQYLHFSSGWAATEDNPFADKVYDVFKLNEFQFVFLHSTPLRLLMPNERAATINYEFEKLQEIPLEKSPKFVFAHIEAPHPPYVFDKDGNIIANEMYDPSGEQWIDKEGYIGQLQYVNQKTIEMIDAILAQSEKDPIIVIHGDHGVDTVLNWVDNPSKERLDERSYILNAYHLPNGGNKELYPTISPVNTFRVIFNYYFNQDYELLEDTTYFSNHYKSPYKFVKVYENGNYVGPYPEQDPKAEELLVKQWWKDE